MTDKKIYEDDREESASSDALNQSGTKSSSGGDEDIAGPDGDALRSKTSHGEMIGEKVETDNEGRVTQRSNTDI